MEILFKIVILFTAGIVILNLLFIITLFAKERLQLPETRKISVQHWWVFYPSFFFQIWFWFNYLNLI